MANKKKQASGVVADTPAVSGSNGNGKAEHKPGDSGSPNVVVLADGMPRDAATMRWLPGAKPPNMITSPTQASALARARWDEYQNAALAGIAEASRKDTPVAGWGYIVQRQAGLAADIDQGRASTEAARFVGQAAGILGVSAGEVGGMGDNTVINVAIDKLMLLVQDMQGDAGMDGSMSYNQNYRTLDDTVIDAGAVDLPGGLDGGAVGSGDGQGQAAGGSGEE